MRFLGLAGLPWWAGQVFLAFAVILAMLAVPLLTQYYGQELRKSKVVVADPGVKAEADLQTRLTRFLEGRRANYFTMQSHVRYSAFTCKVIRK
jgi:hypothetical protein